MQRPPYELKQYTEQVGEVSIEIETLKDLDKAIDQLCQGVDEKDAEKVFVQDLCPYFGVIWPAARALSEHVARMGGWLKDKTVLEVGCGLALPSLVAAKLGARVVATDFHPDVPKFLARNTQLNKVKIDYRSLDWRQETGLGTFDFVIGSDILYESSHPPDVARALARHCHKDSHIVLADPGRVYLQAAVKAIEEQGFRSDMFVRDVLDSHTDRAGDRNTKEVFVFSFQKT